MRAPRCSKARARTAALISFPTPQPRASGTSHDDDSTVLNVENRSASSSWNPTSSDSNQTARGSRQRSVLHSPTALQYHWRTAVAVGTAAPDGAGQAGSVSRSSGASATSTSNSASLGRRSSRRGVVRTKSARGHTSLPTSTRMTGPAPQWCAVRRRCEIGAVSSHRPVHPLSDSDLDRSPVRRLDAYRKRLLALEQGFFDWHDDGVVSRSADTDKVEVRPEREMRESRPWILRCSIPVSSLSCSSLCGPSPRMPAPTPSSSRSPVNRLLNSVVGRVTRCWSSVDAGWMSRASTRRRTCSIAAGAGPPSRAWTSYFTISGWSLSTCLVDTGRSIWPDPHSTFYPTTTSRAERCDEYERILTKVARR